MKHIWSIFMVSLFLVLSACSSATETSLKGEVESGKGRSVTVLDDTGTEIKFEKTPERIGCLTEICVDTLYQLGLEPIAVSPGGITTEPEFFGDKGKDFASIGGSFFEPNIEDIYSNELDLVVGLEGVHDSLRESLKGSVPLYITSPTTYEESLKFVLEFGKILGKEDEAKKVTNDFREKLESYKERSPKDKTALIMYGSDTSFGIDTSKSVMGSLLGELTKYPWEARKGSNEEGAQFSLEEVLKQDPNVIFVETFSFGAEKGPALSEQLAKNPIWRELKAVKNGEVHEVRTNIWASGRGVGSLNIVLEDAMSILYPETVKE
ncbi:ABC transporter substrate-binding protein [Bacillus sp. V2I10]|uniref:ABC transporter substrate-binding protein n=1 Tax=Bacillus sp. V2I10 TaxID=3042276 RepID=UPI0027894B5C|nr:ABC transporter substrate-binding protein [Bacillus sp. V2I10]MDQ0859936.1 iron complex transport system substrate-binding protein [Bacillus sp. V2I10]